MGQGRSRRDMAGRVGTGQATGMEARDETSGGAGQGGEGRYEQLGGAPR